MGGHDRDRPPEQEAARRAVRRLPEAEADAGFRDRLRAQFVAANASQSEDAPSGPPPAQPGPATGLRRLPVVAWVGVTLAAAAAILAMVALLQKDAPGWQLHSAIAEGGLTIDGRAVTAADLAAEPGLLKPGARITTTDQEVVLRSGNVLLLALSPETDATLPAPEGRGRVQVNGGEVRLVTGPRGLAGTLTFETEEASIEVTGTSLAVMHNDQGTCVCVLEGQVQMTNRIDPAQHEVSGGRRWFVNHDGTSDGVLEVVPEHRQSLQALHDEAQTALR